MQFSFYPTLEHSCGNDRHCPHLGGAAIASSVQVSVLSYCQSHQLNAS